MHLQSRYVNLFAVFLLLCIHLCEVLRVIGTPTSCYKLHCHDLSPDTSPDNPFGFNFIPACYRHDFGYHNYRLQSRFTQSGKKRIDDNFRRDLKYQCTFENFRSVCNGLADVYYAAVRAFGGDDATPGKRDEDLVKEYEEKVEIYNHLVEEAQKKGELPRLD